MCVSYPSAPSQILTTLQADTCTALKAELRVRKLTTFPKMYTKVHRALEVLDAEGGDAALQVLLEAIPLYYRGYKGDLGDDRWWVDPGECSEPGRSHMWRLNLCVVHWTAAPTPRLASSAIPTAGSVPVSLLQRASKKSRKVAPETPSPTPDRSDLASESAHSQSRQATPAAAPATPKAVSPPEKEVAPVQPTAQAPPDDKQPPPGDVAGPGIAVSAARSASLVVPESSTSTIAGGTVPPPTLAARAAQSGSPVAADITMGEVTSAPTLRPWKRRRGEDGEGGKSSPSARCHMLITS